MIQHELAGLLRTWLRDKRPRRPVFDNTDTNWHHTAKMLRADLETARKIWLDEADDPEERKRRENSAFLAFRNSGGLVADFHALRHTYTTNIGRSGASMKTHQELARHSEPSLTMRYTHPHVHDKTAALAGLPTLSDQRPDR